MKHVFSFFIFVFVLAAAPCLAAGNQTGADEKVLDVQTATSDSGIEIWLVEDHSVPVISLSFSFAGGLDYDPQDKPGVGRLVSILLDEGAADMDAQAFQKQLTDNAISMGFAAGRDAFTGSLQTITENSPLAFELLSKALSAPQFNADAVTRMKNANIAQIKDSLGDPSWLAARAFNGMLFENHPYAQPGYGHLASMAAITRDDLVAYTRAQFRRDALKVAFAGDITLQQAVETVDRVFGALPKDATPRTTPDAVLAHAGETVLLPLDTPQTYIYAGAPGIDNNDPAWHAASVMNYILGGGGFDSRLMHEIREKRGLTYGIYSTLNSMDRAAVMQVSFSTGNDKAGTALDILKQEWRKMASTGVTDAELQAAKNYLTGALLLRLTSTGNIAGTLNALQQEGRDAAYINRYRSAIKAVTRADILATAQRLLDAQKMTIIMVGQPDGLTADILLDRPPGMRDPVKK